MRKCMKGIFMNWSRDVFYYLSEEIQCDNVFTKRPSCKFEFLVATHYEEIKANNI